MWRPYRERLAEFEREEANAIACMDLLERLKAEGRWPAPTHIVTTTDPATEGQ